MALSTSGSTLGRGRRGRQRSIDFNPMSYKSYNSSSTKTHPQLIHSIKKEGRNDQMRTDRRRSKMALLFYYRPRFAFPVWRMSWMMGREGLKRANPNARSCAGALKMAAVGKKARLDDSVGWASSAEHSALDGSGWRPVSASRLPPLGPPAREAQKEKVTLDVLLYLLPNMQPVSLLPRSLSL
ncbi:hypothetical protein OUZ56_001189 [Daphnia magna]|uniref:Uncharacterized protein n=1 Tax=Daphnia magna TaxID=35525 RepID=A0ABR0A1W7_9CRUS|nr:hypothetical protein OUZ56_001189 [Daphnia magna]